MRHLRRPTTSPSEREARVSRLPARSGATVPARRPGRPKGTGYARQDAPLHEQMRDLLERGQANSPTAAAKRVAELAYGNGCWESKVRRLVRSFPH